MPGWSRFPRPPESPRDRIARLPDLLAFGCFDFARQRRLATPPRDFDCGTRAQQPGGCHQCPEEADCSPAGSYGYVPCNPRFQCHADDRHSRLQKYFGEFLTLSSGPESPYQPATCRESASGYQSVLQIFRGHLLFFISWFFINRYLIRLFTHPCSCPFFPASCSCPCLLSWCPRPIPTRDLPLRRRTLYAMSYGTCG